MAKNFKYVLILCLLVCLFLAGCGGEGGENNKEPISGDSIIYAPTDVNNDEHTHGTDDKFTPETPEADTTDLEVPNYITIETEPKVDPEPSPMPETEAVTDQPADTEPAVIPADTVEVIELGEAFLAGDPAAGSLISQQSDKIQLVVNYNCQMNIDGSVTVDLKVGLECYDVNCGARPDTGKLIVDSDVYTFSTDAIVHDGRKRIYVPFTSYTHQIGAGEISCSIDASWFFNGVYAGTKIDTLTASAIIKWDAPSVEDTSEITAESVTE